MDFTATERLMHFKSLLLVFCVVVSNFCIESLKAEILISNYNLLSLGERGGVQGGAMTARADDASAAWYNPAGLSKPYSNSVSANASLYGFSSTQVGTAPKSTGMIVSPSFAGNIGHISPNLAWSFSVVTPIHSKTGKKTEETKQFPNEGYKDVTVNTKESAEYLVSAPGLSLATTLTDHIRLGFGVRYYKFEINTSSNSTVLSKDTGDDATFIDDSYRGSYSIEQGSLRGDLGIQVDLNDHITMGLVIKGPTYRISSLSKIDQSGNNTDDTFTTTSYTAVNDKGNSNLRLPLEIHFGVAGTYNTWDFEINPKYYHRINKTYASAFPSVEIKGYTRDDGFLPTFGFEPSDPFTQEYEFKSTLNIAIGVSKLISNKYLLQWGAFTDNSPTTNQKQADFFEKVDFYGTTLGVSIFAKNTSTTIGAFYLKGSGTSTATEEISEKELLTPISVQIIGVQMAGSFYF